MPESVLPVEVEEIGSVGMDAWLASLAYGANAVILAVTDHTPPRVVREMDSQIGFATALLEGMGIPEGRIIKLNVSSEGAVLEDLPGALLSRPARFTAPNEKRMILRLAIDHLYQQAPSSRRSAELPAGAPFGEVRVDKNACTLCMGCVSVCPTAALAAGGDLPQLKFVEWNCVQCGLCEKACPEDAIRPHPRMLYDSEARQRSRILHEEQPFCCISCGKPFATKSMLDVMMTKLEGHWMFQSDEARRSGRLQKPSMTNITPCLSVSVAGSSYPMAPGT
jgi:ferredoxin